MFATMFREDLRDIDEEARNISPNVIDDCFGCSIFGHQKNKAYSPTHPSAILYRCDWLRFPQLEAFLLGRNERARTAMHWIMGSRMDKLELLKSISFGARVAEEEITELAKYFVAAGPDVGSGAGTATMPPA